MVKAIRLVGIRPSDRKDKKYDAVFQMSDNSDKIVSFGAKGYLDYTQHHDKNRRDRYHARHQVKENWNAPDTPGSLSRYILWGQHTSFKDNVAWFKRLFAL